MQINPSRADLWSGHKIGLVTMENPFSNNIREESSKPTPLTHGLALASINELLKNDSRNDSDAAELS
ncbi:unnamed protein product, partial [Iphiclides podalirius]